VDSKPDRQKAVLAALGAAVSGAGLYFGSGLHPVWWLTWLAPVPVLLAAPRVSAKLAFLAALFAWGVAGLSLWAYLRHLLGIPLWPVISILLAPALVFAVVVLGYRKLLLRSRLWAASFALPAAWVSYEYLLAVTSPHSTFGNSAYSQMDVLPVLQIASVVGIWGIGYCLMLFPALLGALLSPGGTAPQKGTLAITGGAVLLLVLAAGSWRIHRRPASSGEVTVGLVASDLQENQIARDCDGSLRLLRDYAAQAEKLAAAGAQVVVMPEKLTVVTDDCLAAVDSLYLGTAARSHAAIVVGLIHPSASGKKNEARIYLPGASTATTYAKHHMLPIFESSFSAGSARSVWPEPSGTWGVTICKDMDFPGLGREYAQDGAGLLLVPAWDFGADGWLHGRMAVLRGVESGFSVARAPKQGVLAATDDRGRVVAERDTGQAPFATVIATLPVSRGATFYSSHGDWFAWVCLAGAALAWCGPRGRFGGPSSLA